MKLSDYCIQHPVLVLVCYGLLLLIGILSFQHLPLREYPEIVFPSISVEATYPDASAELVETSVTNVLEDSLAGIASLLEMKSETRNGSSYIKLHFNPDVPMDRAFNAVADSVTTARARLPEGVRNPVIERKKKITGLPFIAIALVSQDKSFAALTHYAHVHIKNIFRAIPGVSRVDVWGQPYTYAIQLDPKKLFLHKVNVMDILDAIKREQISLPAGNFQKTIPVTLAHNLSRTKDFEDLLIRTDPEHPLLLQSLASVRLESDRSSTRLTINGHDGVLLSINQADDANPLHVSDKVKQTLALLKTHLPPDITAYVILDQANFIRASLKNIASAMLEAVILVLLMVFIFLRNYRATLIPLLTIPISLLGTVIFLQILGYSLNVMTLLAMVLGVGLVVDDAIVMLENIWRYMEEGLGSYEASRKGAAHIGFAIIAMTGTLACVYMPLVFIGGMAGQLFIEFAVALAGSVIISGFVSLTLSPVMSAYYLDAPVNTMGSYGGRIWQMFQIRYQIVLSFLLRHKKYPLSFAALACSVFTILYFTMPFEMAPQEDRGLVGVFIPPHVGEALGELSQRVALAENKMGHMLATAQRLAFMGDWGANILLPLKPRSERAESAREVVDVLKAKLQYLPSTQPSVWSWDRGLPGLDNAGIGSELDLTITTQGSYQNLLEHVAQLKALLDKTHLFNRIYYDLNLDAKGYRIQLNRMKMARLGISPEQAARTLAVFFSGDTTQSFEKDGVQYPVTISVKKSPWTLDSLYVTTPKGRSVSLAAIATMVYHPQPFLLAHFQQMRATTLHIELKPGRTIQQQMKNIWQLAKDNLPDTYEIAWTGVAKKMQETGQDMGLLIGLSLIFIFAMLAIQFENFIDPFIILLTVPLAGCGALLLAWMCHQSLNVYTLIGMVTLIGLISKHGILIVTFANELILQGFTIEEAAMRGAMLRLRPVLMTTCAMLLGAVPLVFSSTAGAEARIAIGTVLIGGLGIGTLLTLFVLPTFYSLLKSWQQS